MHVPSESRSDYTPWDSSAPASFGRTLVNNYVLVAVVVLVLYDHLITFAMEVERIWSLRWGLPKVLFLMSRYVVSPLLMITVIGKTGYHLFFSFCIFNERFELPIQALSLLTAQLILLIRVSALYSHGKIMLSFLICLFTCQFAVVIVATVIVQTVSTPTLSYEFFPGCWEVISGSDSSIRWHYSWWIPFICFDGVLFLLTIAKTFYYRDNFNPTIKLLARDSIIYFVIIFASLVVNIASYLSFSVFVTIPPQWIACIAVSRMMMNIRGLMFNDPLDSQGVDFSTVIFRNRDRTGDGSLGVRGD